MRTGEARTVNLLLNFSFALAVCWGGLAQARAETLLVGPNERFKAPSEAAAVAKDGDRIEIAPGEYFDCAVWKANNLTITGTGPDVVITDKTCMGKGLFVIAGNDVTVRNLTLTRARVPDGNGAGIRASGLNLKVEKTRFINNQNGILANPAVKDSGTIEIIDSEFTANGTCENSRGCAHGLYIGNYALLRVAGTKFLATKDGHHIKSRALRTEVVGSDIQDGPKGTSSFLIELPNGGALLAEKNILEKGPNCSNHTAAISIGAEGVTQRTPELIVRNNVFTNDYAGETFFVRNLTATPVQISGNTLKGPIAPLKGDGEVN